MRRNKIFFFKLNIREGKHNVRIKVLKKIGCLGEVKDDCGNEIDTEIKVKVYLRLQT